MRRVLEADTDGPSDRQQPVSGGATGAGRPDPLDEHLVREVVDGVAAAFAELYDRYGRRAYSLARRVCCDDGLAEDVVQEAFVAFWRAPTRFDPQRGAFSTWLLTLVHHKAVDTVRRQSAIGRRTVPAGDDQEWSAPLGPGADQDAIAAVDADHVRAALGQLPEDQRSTLALAYFGGYTQREVAVMTGVPLGTVKSRMFTGIRRLRALLGPVLGDLGSAAGESG